MDEDDWNYRNADHRSGANQQPYRGYPVPAPRAPAPGPMAPYAAPYAPAPGYPPGYPYYHPAAYPPGYPPGYPQPGPLGGAFNSPTIGRLVRALTPLVVAMLPLPQPQPAIAATGDTPTDLKAALTNQANQLVYEQALAEAIKRDETVFAIGEGVGILMEKGLS